MRVPPFAASRVASSKYRLKPVGSGAGIWLGGGAEKNWLSRLIRTMMTGNPVPGTYLSSWNRPLQTPVAPCHSWKSETRTGVPALVFHHCGVGNFVYWIVSRISPVNLYGGGRSWPVTSPPRPPSDPMTPAVMPSLTHSRRVHRFSSSSFSQLTACTSAERPVEDDLRASNLMNQFVRHELFAIDVECDRQEEKHHPHEDRHVRVRRGVFDTLEDLHRDDHREDAEPHDAD